MATPLFARAEIWTDFKLMPGAALVSVIPDLARLTTRRRTTGDDELSAAVPRTSPIYGDLLPRRVIRVVYSDGSDREWRIQALSEDDAGAELVTLSCSSLLVELGEECLIGLTDADGVTRYDFDGVALTATQHIDNYLLTSLAAAGFTFWARGTVDPTKSFDVPYRWDTPNSGLRKLAEATSLNGAPSEIQIRTVGSQYLIDLVAAIGTGATVPDFRSSKNIVALHRAYDTTQQVTRVLPRGSDQGDGSRATIEDAAWQVANIAGTVITLADPNGGDGPLAYDSQLNGKYLRKAGGTLTLISASSASAQTVTVASAASMAVGDLIGFALDSAGKRLTYLDSPTSLAGAVKVGIVDRPELPGHYNRVLNPAMQVWTGAASDPPDLWTKIGTPTLTKTTTGAFTRVGGQSCRVQSTAEGQGLETTLQSVFPTALEPDASGYISFYLAAGRVRVEFIASDGTLLTTFPPPGGRFTAFSNQVGTWVDLGTMGLNLNTIVATSAKIRIVQDGSGTADFYVDAAQIADGAGQLPFVEGSGGTQLWQAGNVLLKNVSATPARYDLQAIDLERLDPASWPFEGLTLGGLVTLTAPNLNVALATRLLELEINELARGDSRCVVSNRPEDFTALLADQSGAPRRSIVPPALRDRALMAYDDSGLIAPPQTKQNDGVATRPLVKGKQTGSTHHSGTVTFPVAFASIPKVTLFGGLTTQAKAVWGATTSGVGTIARALVPENLLLSAINLTAAGFVTGGLLWQKVGTVVARFANWSTQTLTTVGATSTSATTAAGPPPAIGDTYLAGCSMRLVSGGAKYGPAFLTLTAAIDLDVSGSGSSWVQVGTAVFSADIAVGVPLDQTQQSRAAVTASGVTASSIWRWRVVSFVLVGAVTSGPSFELKPYDGTVGSPFHGVDYNTSADQYASVTPDSSDDMTWIAEGYLS